MEIKKPLITLPAHYNGSSIVLDTDFTLQPNDKLLITVLQYERGTDEEKKWTASSLFQLNKLYAEDEPEYPALLIKEPNPDIKNEGRGCCSCCPASSRW